MNRREVWREGGARLRVLGGLADDGKRFSSDGGSLGVRQLEKNNLNYDVVVYSVHPISL